MLQLQNNFAFFGTSEDFNNIHALQQHDGFVGRLSILFVFVLRFKYVTERDCVPL